MENTGVFDKMKFRKFSDLPLSSYNSLNYAVYILDFNWTYLFVNDYVKKYLGKRGEHLTGKNMWQEFKELDADPVFNSIKANMDNRLSTRTITTSPVTSQRLSINGFTLEDCFCFSSIVMPKAESIIKDLQF